jgi:hypothetical protein
LVLACEQFGEPFRVFFVVVVVVEEGEEEEESVCRERARVASVAAHNGRLDRRGQPQRCGNRATPVSRPWRDQCHHQRPKQTL